MGSIRPIRLLFPAQDRSSPAFMPIHEPAAGLWRCIYPVLRHKRKRRRAPLVPRRGRASSRSIAVPLRHGRHRRTGGRDPATCQRPGGPPADIIRLRRRVPDDEDASRPGERVAIAGKCCQCGRCCTHMRDVHRVIEERGNYTFIVHNHYTGMRKRCGSTRTG